MNSAFKNIEPSHNVLDLQDQELPEEARYRDRVIVRVVRDAEAFRSLRPAWESLAAKSPSTIYQSFDWQYLWWRHFGEGAGRMLHVVTVSIDETLAGIFPLFLELKSFLGIKSYKSLRFLGSWVRNSSTTGLFDRYSPSDFLDAIIDPVFASGTVGAFMAYLKEHEQDWDELELDNIPDESIFKGEFLPLLNREQIPFTNRNVDVCPRLLTPASMKDYLASLSSGVRRRFSQARKLDAENNGTYLETVETAEQIDSSLKDLITLHQSRWNKLGYPGVFSDTRFKRFQEDVVRAFYSQGWIWFKTVQTNGVCVAARLGFKYKDRLYDYLSGFSDQQSSSKVRPGLALLLAMIEDASTWGCQSIEFLRGNEPYKFELTSVASNVWNIRIKNPRSRNPRKEKLSQVTDFYETLRYRLTLEYLTFRVHMQQDRFPRSMIQYAGFRVKRLRDRKA